ncbi:MAG TPA: hypothetical protein DCX06_03715 [Opitutae bacterium]|nr:hypothetical protein [Opitutae bacterium]
MMLSSLLKKHAFSFGLFVVVGLAFAFPSLGSFGSGFPAKMLTQIGVGIIFFLLGISIPYQQLKNGYRPMRLHLYVLSWNYLGVPLLTGLLLLILGDVLPREIVMGFWLLAIMPTTIASAVTFTDLSGGSVSNAIFATLLSNVLAVLLVPVFAVLLFSLAEGLVVEFVPLLLKVGLLVLMPLLLGQFLRRIHFEWLSVVKRIRKPISSAIILFIVYAAFAQSVSNHALSDLSIVALLVMLGVAILLMVLVNLLVWWTSKYLALTSADRVAAFYCGSQKSLATGLPLAVMILAAVPDSQNAALMVIPMIVFHPLQLVLAGVLSSWLASKV